MEGGFFDELRQLDFFSGAQDEKRGHSCVPVTVTSTPQLAGTEHLNQGIYPDEESVDLSVLLEACNSEHSTSSSPNNVATSIPVSVSSGTAAAPVYQESQTSNSNFSQFQNFLSPNNTLPGMYGTENYEGSHLHGHHVEITPSSPSLTVDCSNIPPHSTPHVVQIESSAYPPMRPAPGKAQRSGKGSKKVDKNTLEYRMKRDRNNVAVRKSREKSKVRVQDTEKRVKELEDENMQLQSKIALLTKELNVLKSLFTSAGVSQPPSFHLYKDEGRGE